MTGVANLWLCRKCGASYAVAVIDQRLDLLKKTMRCPNAHECGGTIKQYAKPSRKNWQTARTVDAVQLYQASLGLGLLEERKCGPVDLLDILIGAKVVSARIDESPDPQRSVLYSLTLDNGKILHLGSSPRGATIYRITEAHERG